MVEAWLAPKQIESFAKAAGYVTGGAALVVAAYGLYWFFDAGWGIVGRINSSADEVTTAFFGNEEENKSGWLRKWIVRRFGLKDPEWSLPGWMQPG